MAKIALITDTHIGVRNDNPIFYRFMEKFFKKIFFPTIDEMGIKHIIHLGDLVDRRKYINFVTASKIDEMFMKPIIDRELELYMIAGNHDCYYKNSNKVNSIKQLYGNIDYNKFYPYWDSPKEINIDGLSILLVPWISPENQKRMFSAINDTNSSVLMGHFEITGFVMHQGSICTHGIDANIFSRFQEVFSGHFHESSKSGNVKYLGCPYEMTWGDSDTQKGFHIFDTETLELTFIPNPFKLFHKFFYNDSNLTVEEINELDSSEISDTFIKVMVEEKNNPYIFDMLLDKFHNSGVFDIKIIDETRRVIHDERQIINEAEDTTVIMKKYVDSIETNLNKDEINNLMQELYKEAHN